MGWKKKEDYREDVDDDVASAGGDKKPFFASAEGVSYHASSFLELHLSRPLLRACEALGYTKPTPIQVFCLFPVFIPIDINLMDLW